MMKMFKTDDSWVSLVQRVVLALVIFPHGAQKLLGWFGGYGFPGTMGFFVGIGIPAPLAFLVIIAESLGAVALLLGFLSRPTAFGIAAVMVGAALYVHLPHGFFMNWFGNQPGEGFEFHLLAVALALPLIVRGGGLASLDALIARRLGTRERSFSSSSVSSLKNETHV